MNPEVYIGGVIGHDLSEGGLPGKRLAVWDGAGVDPRQGAGPGGVEYTGASIRQGAGYESMVVRVDGGDRGGAGALRDGDGKTGRRRWRS